VTTGDSPHDKSRSPSATQLKVAALWREVLQINERPRAADDFFSLGGDSMAMVILEFRIKEEFGVELSPGAVLGAPTLREVSALIDAARKRSAVQRPDALPCNGNSDERQSET
jgi:acyl carrier protein